jgi:hypothetical protein
LDNFTAADMANDTTLELRGQCPRETIDVLDAVSAARRMSRTELVNSILASWVVDRLNEARMIERVTRGNPMNREPSGRRTE